MTVIFSVSLSLSLWKLLNVVYFIVLRFPLVVKDIQNRDIIIIQSVQMDTFYAAESWG